VEGAIEGNICQVGGPYSLGWINKESTGQACETVTNKVGGESHENWKGGKPWTRIGTEAVGLRTLVPEVGSVRLVKVEWQVLDPDDLQAFGQAPDCVRDIMRRT